MSQPEHPRKRPKSRFEPASSPLQGKLHEIIFEAEAIAGKAFDLLVLLAIVASVVVVMLESVDEIRAAWGTTLWAIEIGLTLAFTVEFALRCYCVRRPWNYVRSFFGQVDFWSIVPTYVTLLGFGAQALVVIRTLRIIRIFRVLELGNYADEATMLVQAMKRSQAKIVVFLVGVMSMVLIIGATMYLIERDVENTGFTSLPRSVYWAIVTMTTVGYGDIAPQTMWGQALAAAAMVLGYSVIIVPMGIFSVEAAADRRVPRVLTRSCPACAHEGHDEDAIYCKRCAARL